MIDPYKILSKRRARKEELRAALAQALGEPVPTWAEVDESLVARCRNLFAQAYEVATGNTYRFAAKDYKAIAALVGKVTDATTAKNPYAGREEIERAFIWLLKHLPRWYRESGFSACIINGKFNEIVAAIKHGEGQNNKPNTGVSAEYLEAIAKGLR